MKNLSYMVTLEVNWGSGFEGEVGALNAVEDINRVAAEYGDLPKRLTYWGGVLDSEYLATMGVRL